MGKSNIRRIPADLLSRLLRGKDIANMRSVVLASMLVPLGVDVKDILTTEDKDRLMAYLLRSGVVTDLYEAGDLDKEHVLELWNTPIEGVKDK
jgi:hypothetical protein